jgi:hypothetical protein
MGKQSNKVEKRRRRLSYLERKKAKSKDAAGGSKPKLRRPVAKKEKEKEKEKRAPAPPADAGAATAAAPKEAAPE